MGLPERLDSIQRRMPDVTELTEGRCEICHYPMNTAEYQEPCVATSLHKERQIGCALCNYTGLMTIKDTICEECLDELIGEEC